MEKSQNNRETNPMTLMNQTLAEPYYLFHFIALFSYVPLRSSASQILSPHLSSHLFDREIQAVLAFSVLSVVKIVREETWEAFIADTLFFAKIFLVGITLVIDYRLALWYVLVFLVIYVLAPQPAYQGLGFSSQLTPLQLEALLTEGNMSRFWLVFSFENSPTKMILGATPSLQTMSAAIVNKVEFRALSSSKCVRTGRLFPELSITYSNKNLSFGIVDLGLFPNTAEKFGISIGSGDKLPSYILFENAVEVTRWPEVEFEVKASNLHLSKKLLCRHFELDLHLIDYINGK